VPRVFCANRKCIPALFGAHLFFAAAFNRKEREIQKVII
jgi:hypothetical protein